MAFDKYYVAYPSGGLAELTGCGGDVVGYKDPRHGLDLVFNPPISRERLETELRLTQEPSNPAPVPGPNKDAFVPFKVRCLEDEISHGCLEAGCIYTVCGENRFEWLLEGVARSWDPARFERIEEPAPEPANFLRKQLDELLIDNFRKQEALAAKREAEAHVARTTEKVRPPLTWAQSKPFDAFPGFEVVRFGGRSDMRDKPHRGLPSPDLAPSSHLVEPGFGSAYLKGDGQ